MKYYILIFFIFHIGLAFSEDESFHKLNLSKKYQCLLKRYKDENLFYSEDLLRDAKKVIQQKIFGEDNKGESFGVPELFFNRDDLNNRKFLIERFIRRKIEEVFTTKNIVLLLSAKKYFDSLAEVEKKDQSNNIYLCEISFLGTRTPGIKHLGKVTIFDSIEVLLKLYDDLYKETSYHQKVEKTYNRITKLFDCLHKKYSSKANL